MNQEGLLSCGYQKPFYKIERFSCLCPINQSALLICILNLCVIFPCGHKAAVGFVPRCGCFSLLDKIICFVKSVNGTCGEEKSLKKKKPTSREDTVIGE